MSALNTSNEGPAITRSYQSIVNSSAPSSASPTFAKWVVLHAAAPLASAFQQDSGKESVLRVQSAGEGELQDLIDEFNEGRIQYAFAKVKDPNSSLQKSVLIAWCGEGVPERTKGYFTTHTATVSRLLHGYHVQVTARSDRDLTPESIIRKVADSSGSRYSGDNSASNSAPAPPPIASKPVFQPSRVGGSAAGFKPLGAASSRSAATNNGGDNHVRETEAPSINRKPFEGAGSSFKQNEEATPAGGAYSSSNGPEVVRGGYQPIGKVDIAAIRRQAQESGNTRDERPTIVKGAYEPVGKVDIAAIRAKAAGPGAAASTPPPSTPAPASASHARTGASDSEPKSLAERSAAFSQTGRLTSMPKPKVAPKFGGSAFSGTKAPTPAAFEATPAPAAAPVGAASRTFADQGGKTPAQLWAERKARERGESGTSASATTAQSQLASQTSGDAQWQSGYAGKKWAAVQTTKTGGSALSNDRTGEEPAREEAHRDEPPSGGVGSIRDRFKESAPMGASLPSTAPPPMDFSSKPNAGVSSRGVPVPGMSQGRDDEVNRDAPPEEKIDMPPPPAQPPRSDNEEEEEAEENYRSSSPIRIAQPVSRSEATHQSREEPSDPLSRSVPQPQDADEEAEEEQPHQPTETSVGGGGGGGLGAPGAQHGGKRAKAEYDYEKAEDNEIDFAEGELITNIDMVDEDWWMGTNSKGESGLFPANYVVLLEGGDDDDNEHEAAPEPAAAAQTPPALEPVASTPAQRQPSKPTATAEYDYEAAEDNELSFPENATITDIEFPDEDWWSGKYDGKEGLFPANYVKLNE